MSSTMTFVLVFQTLTLLDVTHKSTQDEVFTPVAIATAEYAFVCSVVSIVIKRRINRKKIGRLYAFSVHWVGSTLCPILGSKTCIALLYAYDI